MTLRPLIKRLQEGVKIDFDDNFLLRDSLLSLNTANGLLEFIRTSSTVSPPNSIVEHSRKAQKFSHAGNNQLREKTMSGVLSGSAVIVVSHQPTFFPYSGLYVQFVLADYLSKTLKNNYGVDAVIVYLCLDSDDAWDRRIKTAHLPFPSARRGSIPISFELKKADRNVPQFFIPFFDKNYKITWRNAIIGNYNSLYSAVPQMKTELRKTQNNMVDYLDYLLDRTVDLDPKSFSDFSLSIIMRFLKDLIETPVIPVRFSDMFSSNIDTISNVFEKWGEIVSIGEDILAKFNLNKATIFDSGPAWLICKTCFFRNNALLKDVSRALEGIEIDKKCTRCRGKLSKIQEDFIIMPKVILEDISGILLTGANLILTYAGSAQHVVLSNIIYQSLFNKESPIYTWHPKHFLGSPLETAALELIDKQYKADSAKNSLRLSCGGRDSLLFLNQYSNINELTAYWHRHFRSGNLSETMIFHENHDFFDRCQNVIGK